MPSVPTEIDHDTQTEASAGHNQPIEGVHHVWPVARRNRKFRVGIVEPAQYHPATHAQLFISFVTRLVGPTLTAIGPAEASLSEPFDLVTWPEAFLPDQALRDVLLALLTQSHFPCMHVGLRPDDQADTHLFSHGQLEDLVWWIRSLGPTISEDLAAFSGWLDGASRTGFYNVACVFLIDARGELRVCMHPKNTPASVEVSALVERNIAEAEFCAVVTLDPLDSSLFQVNIQPLICSDMLDLQRDTHRLGPMAVLASSPQRVGPDAPEHIDIVSVATCTDQKNEAAGPVPERLTWQPKFRAAFTELMEGTPYARHRNAMVVLANVRRIGKKPGGLSGSFIPLPLPKPAEFGEIARTWSWGRQDHGDNHWLLLRESVPLNERWSSLAHLVTLDPDLVPAPLEDQLISFTIPSLPRDRPRTDRGAAITALQVTGLGIVTLEDGAQEVDADD